MSEGGCFASFFGLQTEPIGRDRGYILKYSSVLLYVQRLWAFMRGFAVSGNEADRRHNKTKRPEKR